MRRVSIETVIVGGGQAGLAMSYHLTQSGRDHVVLEQARVVESWRSKRWDSLRLIAPNWSLRLPGFAYSGDDPDSFMGKGEVVGHLEGYARSFDAPVQEGVRVTSVERPPGERDFEVRTEEGVYKASHVVLATGALQRPHVPDYAAAIPAGIAQLVPYAYRNPAALPPGAVLVVGSGQSGCQIAEEIRRSGRTVYLAVSRCWWLPRRYRGHDSAFWARVLGMFDQTVDDLPLDRRTGTASPHLTGADGGHDLSVYTLAREGVTLLGRMRDFHDGQVVLAPDLASNLTWGDAESLGFLRSVDAHIETHGLVAPLEEIPPCMTWTEGPMPTPPEALDLSEAGIGTVIWATGYRPDFDWVHLPIFDAAGYPVQRRGVTSERGLYVLGLDWLHKRSSGLFAGVGDDAAFLAETITSERHQA